MMKFRMSRVVPPGGVYAYVVDATGAAFSRPTMSTLLDAVRGHLRANGLPVPGDLAAVVEDYVCRHAPEGFCYGDAEGRPVVRGVTLPQIKAATQRLVAAGGRTTPGEARTRVDICGRCACNDRRMCPSCVGLISWARKLVGASCPRDEWLGVCSVDCVALAAKVHVARVPGDEGYPEGCWARKTEG